MEEKYDQIEMDIGDLKLTSDEPDSSSPEENAKKPTRQAEPVTLQIDNSEYEHAEEEIDDDTELISPDEEIFKRAANQIKNADRLVSIFLLLLCSVRQSGLHRVQFRR